jgi:extracellular elastinolytic metalloproteinase
MRHPLQSRRPYGRSAAVVAGAVALATTLALSTTPASTADPAPPGPLPNAGADHGFQGEGSQTLDKDARGPRVAPTKALRTATREAGENVRFNRLGTPATLVAGDAALAAGLGKDPAAAADRYVLEHRDQLGLTQRAAESLEQLTVQPLGKGAVVIYRQRFGDLDAGYDGMLSVAVRNGAVRHVSSSLSPDTAAPEPATLTEDEAEAAAAADARFSSPDVQRVRLVAVPVPGDTARAAYQVVLGSVDDVAAAVMSYVDARTGEVLLREDLVDHDSDNPEWDVFPANPPVDYSSTDTRRLWCWTAAAGCDETVGTVASPLAWDVDPATGETTQTTRGNNSIAVENLNSNDPFSVGTETATPSPTREYAYPWTNQWYEQSCNPDAFTSPERADLDAARANLFGMHNRMHDWTYHLGFTETAWNMQQDNFGKGGLGNDYEQGNAQAGGISGGPPTFAARDNANQITGPDGVAPITNMYLWQPIAGSFYAPCVDGDYDMSVIGHEYGHAVTNRMIAGPDGGLTSALSQGLSESWSDLMAMEYLNEHGYAADGLQAYTAGQYATGDAVAGIRNYNMSRSPLNYSDIGYDVTGPQVHADGEIWTATNFDVRQAFIDRYGEGSAAENKACANGETPAQACPGGRRWIQLVFDSFLLLAVSAVSQVDARDAFLAADQIRFGGANQDIIWNAFAKRGLGEGATSLVGDADPVPGFTSPFSPEGSVELVPRDVTGATIPGARLFVGHYQARAVPVADTDGATPLRSSASMVPGRYDLVLHAPGYGHARVEGVTVREGKVTRVQPTLRANLASAAAGATVAAGDGINQARLIDDDEATQWAALGAPVAGRSVTVDLAGGQQNVRRVQVSALLRQQIASDPDSGSQSRFSAVRQFAVYSCNAAMGADCGDPAAYTLGYTSPADAFPAIAPRPRAPQLIIRSFDVPRIQATHLRFQVVTNQCTGAPDYAGEQDADPRATSDCTTGSAQANNVRAAEFQAFSQ